MYLNTLSTVSPAAAGKKGFQWFCTPIRSKLKDHQLRFLNSAERFTMEVEGDIVAGYKWGSGSKKVLFMHGWQSHSFRWKRYIERFNNDRHTLYAFDAPGHGLSRGKLLNVPIYANVLDHFITQITPVDTIVSHSIGSFAALYAMHNRPELNVQKIVTLGAPGEAMSFFGVEHVRHRFIEVVGHEPEYFTTERFVRNQDRKALIIHDVEDKDVDFKYSEILHKAWKGSQLWITKGYGHKLTDHAVVDRVLEFV